MEQKIKLITANALNVLEEQVHVESRLMGGMSNLMYLITVKGGKYTFRIPGKNAEVFVNRATELSAINQIESLNLNNKTVYFDLDTGYKIAEFVEGTPLSEMKNPELYLEEVAQVLHRLHDSKLTAINEYAPFERLEKYEKLIKEKEVSHELSYFDLKAKLLKNQTFLNQFNKVFCHNDSQISNIVLAKDKTYLLDWEFAGQNDPFYDLACVGNQDFDLALKILPIYLGKKPVNQDFKRLYLWRAFQCLQWHNVALYKDLIGLSQDLNVDFKLVAENYLKKADNLLMHAERY